MDSNTYQSTIKYLFIFARNIVNGSFKCQHLIILSSTEAEYITFCQKTNETI